MENIISIIDEIEKLCYSEEKENVLKKTEELINVLDKKSIYNSGFIMSLNMYSNALEKKDYVLAADYLEYGLKAIIGGTEIPDCLLNDNIGEVPKTEESIFYVSSYTDELVLCVKKEDGTNIRFNSPVSPEHEADVLYSILNLKNNTPAVCLFGIGTGLIAKRILDTIPKDGKLIIYEPNDIVVDYCISSAEKTDSDVTERIIGKRIKNIINDKRTEIYYHEDNRVLFTNILFSKMDYRDLYGLRLCVNSGYRKYAPKELMDYLHSIEDFRRITITNKNTIIRFGDHYVDNVFRNLWVCKKMNVARELGKILSHDIPVIIVSAGPSLNKNVEELRNAKGHSLIVAVDSAVNFLVEKDIIPDLTITVDPIKSLNCYNDERALDIPCIIDIDANYEIIEKLKGNIFVLANNSYLNQLLESVDKRIQNDPLGGGSVATVIFSLICELGQKKIIFVGQDLASSGGKTHAGVKNDGPLGTIMVEGINGEMVSTRPDWFNYLKWFEIAIKRYKAINNDLRVIDATEGGAKIAGTEIMTLREAIDDFRDTDGDIPNYDLKNELGKLNCFLNEEEYKEFCKNHKRNVAKLDEVEVEAEDVVRTCKKLILEIENDAVNGVYIDKKKEKISKVHEHYRNNPMHSLINKCLNGAIVDKVSHLSLAEGDAKERELNGIRLLQVSFENIAKVAKLLSENAKKYMSLLEEI